MSEYVGTKGMVYLSMSIRMYAIKLSTCGLVRLISSVVGLLIRSAESTKLWL